LAPLATPNTIYIETHRSVRDYAFLGLNSPHTPAVYPIGIHRAVYSVRCFYGLFLCAEGVHLFISMQNDPIHPFSLHLTPTRLRTGESMHLVRFWPSLTSMARRQLWASAVQCSGESERSVVSMLCRRGGYYFHGKQIIFRKDNTS
jgi:hypothetical protein